jgi:hypothetical protein
MKLRRRLDAPDVLPLHVLDFLLGQARSIAAIMQLQAAGVEYDSFAQFDLDRMPVEEFRALWHAHLPRLRTEAERRGIPLPDPATYQSCGCWVNSELAD